MSLFEITDLMQSFVRMDKRKHKQELIDGFALAKANATNIAIVLGGKGNFCEAWDFYPDLFDDAKEQADEKKVEREMSEYTEKRKKMAAEFNRRLEQGKK